MFRPESADYKALGGQNSSTARGGGVGGMPLDEGKRFHQCLIDWVTQ